MLVSTILEFTDAADAREYRHHNGTGGWIFAPEDGSHATLFPPHMAPYDIFHHPMTRGKTGNLIGHA